MNRPSSRKLFNHGYAFLMLGTVLLYVHEYLVTDSLTRSGIGSLVLLVLGIAFVAFLLAIADKFEHGQLGWRRGLGDLPIDDPSHTFCWKCGSGVTNEFCDVCGAKVRPGEESLAVFQWT